MVACAMLNSCQVIAVDDREWKVDSMRIPDPAAIVRRALLVEYTGWRCPNCPRASNYAHELQESNPGGLIVVEFHPATNGLTRPDRGGKDDYTCPEADEYYLYMSGTTDTPFPTGVFDFMPQEDGTYFTDESTWGVQMLKSCQREVVVAPIASATVDAASREVQVDVTIVSVVESAAGLQCVVWLTEDSIIGQQYEGMVKKSDYSHNHVLRQSLTNVWGLDVQLAGVPTQVPVSGVVREDVVLQNAHIVVVLMREKQVLNCCEVPLVISE